jgi:hypothetical protein
VFINVDIGGAILRCREMGYADKDIIIDIIFLTFKALPKFQLGNAKTFNITMRAFELKRYTKSQSDYVFSRDDYPDVNYRYVVAPSQPLASELIPLDMNHEKIMQNLDLGVKDGLAAINAGEGVMADRLLEEFREMLRKEESPEIYSLDPEETEQVEVTQL